MELLFSGLANILNPPSIIIIFLGVAVGIIFGSIPGLTAAMAIALCLPITYGMDTIASFALLIALYLGGISGGLISAILLRIPGTPSSVATTFDGSPMAARGEAGKALAIGIISSFIGGLFSFAVLFALSPLLARVAIRFTQFDYFSVVLFSITMMASLSGANIKKGLVAGFLGILIAMVGADPIDGIPRFTLNIHQLDGGLALLPVLIGLFAVAEVIEAAEHSANISSETAEHFHAKKISVRLSDFKGQAVNMLRSCLIGTGIGILPGIGGGVSNILSYTAAKNQSGKPEKFGTGCVDGIIASEAANNASIGGAMVPLLTLGIPGDTNTALLIGALMIHGITPGPLLFIQQKELVYSIFGILVIANCAMLILMLLGMHGFIKVLSLPKPIILPIVLAICMIGAFGSNNRLFDVWVVLIFGIAGYIMKKFDFPAPPMIMGLILGPILETSLRRGLMFSHGSVLPFFNHPVSLIFLLLTACSITLAVRQQRRSGKKHA